VSATAATAAYLMDLPGLTPYATALREMENLAGARSQQAIPDTLMLLEHEPVVTLGTRTDVAAEVPHPALLEQRGIPVIEVARGGRATYHGPGQLVGYPVLDLSRMGRDLRAYVEMLEGAMIDTLGDLGIEAVAREGEDHTGVWVEDRKIASIGVHVATWITTHGFALNLDCDLEPFDLFVGCGLQETRYTTASLEAGRAVTRAEAQPLLLARLGERFNRTWELLPA
jgi:lipoate-protein ligase B